MFNPPAHIAFICFGQFLDRADDFGIRRIANGVHRGLKPVHRCPHHQVADFGARQKLQASLSGRVGIGFLEPSTPAAQSAIKIQLHAAQPQFVVVQPRAWRRARNSDHIVDATGIGKYPDGQPSRIACSAIALPIVQRRTHVGNRCDAQTVQFLLRFAQGNIAFQRFGCGHEFANQIGSGINKNTARFSASQLNAPARR